MTRSIEIENVGPIKHLEIPIPDSGLVILRACHGGGKSTALRAVGCLLTGEGALDKRDGTISGAVNGCGVSIKIQKSTRRTGTLEVSHLEDKLSIADLVDPHVSDPEAADRKRIAALVQLSGAGNDPKVFHDLLGGFDEFRAVVGEVKGADVLDLAKKVKRGIETAARDSEAAAERAGGVASTQGELAGNCGPEWLADPSTLRVDLEQAIADEARIKATFKAANDAKEKADAAAEKLAEAGTDAAVKLAEAERTVLEFSNGVAIETDRVSVLRDQLASAEARKISAEVRLDHARTMLEAATEHADTVAGWQETVNAAAEVESPTEEDVAHAEEYVESRRNAIVMHERASVSAAAKIASENAAADAKANRELAERLRKAAGGVDGVLTKLVGTLDCPLRVREGRLVLDTDRGEEFFSDLSEGERVIEAIEIIAPHVPAHGVLPIPQELFQALNESSRRAVAARLKKLGITGITALPTDDAELTAEVFDGGGTAPIEVPESALDEVGHAMAARGEGR